MHLGLRDRKKSAQRAALIENAIALFARQGHDRVTVREIAERAFVSEATFYNYFQTRSALLSAWLALEEERALQEVAQPEATAAPGLRRGARAFAAAVARRLEPHAGWLSRTRSPIAAAPVPSPALEAWIRAAQQSGEVRGDLEASTLSGLWRAAVDWAVAEWRAVPARAAEAPAPGLEARLRAALDLVLDGARKRNERVRAPVAEAALPGVS